MSKGRKVYPWQKGRVLPGHPITLGAQVRGNYSEKIYLVEFTGEDSTGAWWIQGRDQASPLSTGWFHHLGERQGDKIAINDERRPADHLLVINEQGKKTTGQLEFTL